MNDEKQTRPRRRGLVVPLLLIVLGVVFLLNNLRLLTTGVWPALLNLWPLLLVLVAFHSLVRRREVVGPAVLLGVAGVFLAVNFGLAPWGIWASVLRMWPLLLVAGGLEIILARRSTILAVLSVLVLVGILGGALVYTGGFRATRRSLTTEAVRFPLGDFTQAEVKISPAAGAFSLSALADSPQLIEGTVDVWAQENLISDFSIEDGVGAVRLESRSEGGFFFPDEDLSRAWTLGLSPDIPLTLDITLGAGESSLDLTALTLDALVMHTGVGQTEIDLPSGDYAAEISAGVGLLIINLPPNGSLTLEIKGGVGAIILRVPRGAPVFFDVSHGLGGIEVPATFEQFAKDYASPAFNEGGEHITVNLSQGVGSIAIRER